MPEPFRFLSLCGMLGYRLRFLKYGLNAVTGGRCVPANQPPREVGLVIEALAPTQGMADVVLSLARSTALHQHFEGRKTTAGNLAFPFSPSDLQGGAVYDFSVYHLMETLPGEPLFSPVFQDI